MLYSLPLARLFIPIVLEHISIIFIWTTRKENSILYEVGDLGGGEICDWSFNAFVQNSSEEAVTREASIVWLSRISRYL